MGNRCMAPKQDDVLSSSVEPKSQQDLIQNKEKEDLQDDEESVGPLLNNELAPTSIEIAGSRDNDDCDAKKSAETSSDRRVESSEFSPVLVAEKVDNDDTGDDSVHVCAPVSATSESDALSTSEQAHTKSTQEQLECTTTDLPKSNPQELEQLDTLEASVENTVDEPVEATTQSSTKKSPLDRPTSVGESARDEPLLTENEDATVVAAVLVAAAEHPEEILDENSKNVNKDELENHTRNDDDNDEDDYKDSFVAQSNTAAVPVNQMKIPQITDPSNAGRPELQGISVYWLRHGLLAEVEQEEGLSCDSKVYEIEDLSSNTAGIIRRKGLHVPCPMFDGFVGSSYVHGLLYEEHIIKDDDDDVEDNNNVADRVGDATHMLSYSWSYTVGDIVDTVETFCSTHGLDPQQTYVWICCLCNNQHKIVHDRKTGRDVPSEEFHRIFKDHVIGIGRLICMMAPWDAPTYLTRVWCIFEIDTAMKTKQTKSYEYHALTDAHGEDEEKKKNNDETGCEIFVAMPPRERERMWSQGIVRKGVMDILYRALSNTRVEEAKASVESDRVMILDLLRESYNSETTKTMRMMTNNSSRQQKTGATAEATTAVVQDSGEEEGSNIYKAGNDYDEDREIFAQTNMRVNEFLRGWVQSSIEVMLKEAESNYDQGLLGHSEYARICNNVGLAFHIQGDLRAALTYHSKALTVQEANTPLGNSSNGDENHYDDDDDVLATSYNNVGSVLNAMKRHEEALPYLRKGLERRQVSCGMDDLNTAQSHNNIGTCLMDLGQYDEALKEHEKALAIREGRMKVVTVVTEDGKEELQENHHPDTALTYSNLGALFFKVGRYEDAILHYRKAITLQNIHPGKDHPDTAASHENLGSVLSSMGRIDEAILEKRTALAIYQVTFGNDHPTVANAINGIGVALNSKGLHEPALLEFQRAMRIREAILGKHHADTAASYNNVGSVLDDLGRYEEALLEMRKGLVIQESLLGTEHPDLATSYNNIAMVLKNLGRYDEALVWYRKAVEVQKTSLGEEHPVTGAMYGNIGALLERKGLLEEALIEKRRALAIQEASLGLTHPWTKGTYQSVVQTLFAMDRKQEAYQMVLEHMDLFQ